MTSVIEFPDRDTVERDAAAWVAKLDAGTLSREDLQALRRWALQSSQHRSTLEAMAASWDSLDVLVLARPPERSSSRFEWRWQGVGAALAAGVAVFAVAIGFLRIQPGEAPEVADPINLTYVTAIGEQRSVTLPDLSTIRINTNSRLQVDYSPEQRSILLHRGEAFFEVAESTHPFVVTAGRSHVTALGTAFAVHLLDNNVVEIDVAEGRVLVSADPGPSGSVQSLILSAGDVARVGPLIELVQRVEPAIIEQQLSWREGMLFFDGDSLESVIDEVSRYTPVEIVIADPSLRNLKIGGYFPIGETDVLLATLASSFDVESNHIRPGLIYLRPKSR